MDSVVAKFAVGTTSQMKGSVKQPDGSYGSGTVSSIEMRAVFSNDPNSENAQFFAATPNGVVNLSMVNPGTAAFFELGEEYYATFTKVPKPAVG